MARNAWGVGLATIAADGTTLDTFYRHLGFGDSVPAGTPVEAKTITDERRGVVISPVSIVVDVDAAPTSAVGYNSLGSGLRASASFQV